MPRPKIKVKLYLQNLINEQLELFLINEILDKAIETKYEIFSNIKDGNEYYRDVYRFKTNNNYYYDVEFYKDILSKDEICFIEIEDEYVRTIIIGFTVSEISNSNIDNNLIGRKNDPYINKTNRNEQYEVLGKISHLINEYMRNNPKISMFRILKNTHKNNLSTYNHIFKKQFEKDFTVFETIDEFLYLKNDFTQ